MNKKYYHTIESNSISLSFDEHMNLREMRIGREKYRFAERSSYLISGKEARVEKVERSGECLKAQLKTRTAHAELKLKGGSRIALQVSVDDWEPIESIEIVFPFPRETTMIKVEKMPVDDEILLRSNEVRLQSSLIDVGESYLMFGTRSKEFYFSNSRFIRTKEGLNLCWNWEPKAPFPKKYQTPELYFEKFDCEDEALQEYEGWMERSFGVKTKKSNPYVPDWLHKCRLVLVIDLWIPVGDITHTFAEVMRLIKELKEMNVPSGTILYLLGWHWKYDGHFPEYWPAEELGGAKKFQALVNMASECGYHIMPHFNHQGFDPDLPSFKKFSQYQQIDASGKKLQHPEPQVQEPTFVIIYMDPAAEPWRKYLVGKITKPAREFGLDAIFLDQFNYVPNTPTNLRQGQFKLLRDLREGIPGALFGAEVLHHEAALGMAPLLQLELVGKVLYSWPEYRDDGLFQTRPKAYLSKKWHFKDYKLVSDYHYFFPWIGVVPAVPGRYVYNYFRYITEVGFEKAFRASQDLADEVGMIKTLRLNYREYGIDPLSRKEIEKVL